MQVAAQAVVKVLVAFREDEFVHSARYSVVAWPLAV